MLCRIPVFLRGLELRLSFNLGLRSGIATDEVSNYPSNFLVLAEFMGCLPNLGSYRLYLRSLKPLKSTWLWWFNSCIVTDSNIPTGLYNATVAQLAYNSTFNNGTTRPPVVLRTTGQSRIENSQINWALGFFGPSFETVPSPTLANWTDPFRVVIIPEGGTENNTLASYDSKHSAWIQCFISIENC